MNRTITFARRNLTEISRDPLSYIFCIAFPLVMLAIMSLVNSAIPKEGVTIFRIDRLCGGIAIFGQTFVMLFTALTVTTDRSGSFLIRLYTSPMKSENFTGGYLLPMLVIALVQSVLAFAASYVVSLITGVRINPAGLLLATVALLPSALMFSAIGLIFGTLFNEKSAPGLCSIIISLGSFLGGIWFDAEATGGVLYKICRCLPFIYCTKTARAAVSLSLTWEEFFLPLLIVLACAALFTVAGSLIFRARMKADLA